MARLNPVALWRRFLALPNDSRGKALGVVILVALVCAAAVSVTAVSLRPLQEVNVERQRIERLAALLRSVPGLAEIVGTSGASELEVRLVDLATGAFLPGTADGFDAAAAAADPARSTAVPAAEDIAGIGRRADTAQVFLLSQDAGIALVVLPIYGAGYLSTIRAYLALEGDLNTVAALSVYEQRETPGLGARVAEPAWEALWPGTAIADETGAIRIAVVRGGADEPYEIDGITGATRTSSGVSAMVRFWLGDWGYGPFLRMLEDVPRVALSRAAPEPASETDQELAGVDSTGAHLLGDRHVAMGLTCNACHQSVIPAVGAAIPIEETTTMCLGCHGSFASVAALTAALFPNPHASHFGNLPCGTCHRAHEEPVDFCAQCHAFGFVVP